jgi:hypothetical protein
MAQRITASQATKINRMNRAAQDVVLGTIIRQMGNIATGSHTVTGAQQNASAIVIDTTLGSSTGQIVQLYRGGSPIFTSASAFRVVNSAGSITISGSYIGTSGLLISASDIVNWIAFKA